MPVWGGVESWACFGEDLVGEMRVCVAADGWGVAATEALNLLTFTSCCVGEWMEGEGTYRGGSGVGLHAARAGDE